MQLMGISGERGLGDPRRFVLEVAGRTVGRLEVELPRGPGQRGVDEVLTELVPWFAIALETARSGRGEPKHIEETELARRAAASPGDWPADAPAGGGAGAGGPRQDEQGDRRGARAE